ncbi:ATP-binding protein [Enterococcus rivorum]|nr:ATP-binding protein [Enterococcus rivorum]
MDGQELRRIRKKLDYNLRDFAEKVGISRAQLSKYEREVTGLSEERVNQIKQKIGLALVSECELHVHFDYLKFTFFDSTIQTVIETIIGIPMKYFIVEETKQHNYQLKYSCGNLVVFAWIEDDSQGILMDLTGQGVYELEQFLESKELNLKDWLANVLDSSWYLSRGYYSRLHSTRLDIAIDEIYDPMNGNFDLYELKKRRDQDLIKTDFQVYREQEKKFREDHGGLTLYYGSRGGEGMFVRFYEKRYELASKMRMTLDEVLEEHGIWNRYELELGKGYNEQVFNDYINGVSLDEIAINLLLSKFEVYDEQVNKSGNVERMRFRSEYGESFSSFMPVDDMGVFLDGNHLLEIVQKMPFGVGMKIQAVFSENKGQLALSGRSSRARTRTKNIMQEAHVAGTKQKRKILEGQLSLDDLDQKIDDGEDILDWKAFLVVSGAMKKQMNIRKKYLLNRFSGLKMPLLKATFDNPYLFQSTLYGNFTKSKYQNSKWRHTSTVASFAEMNFFTSLKSGTSLGFYFGRVDSTIEEKEDRQAIVSNSKNLIYLNILLSNKQNIKGKKTNNPHFALVGDTGNGKSVTAKKLFMECALMKDRVLYIDPKKEMRRQYMRVINDKEYQKKYPLDVEFIKSFNFVTLDVRDKKNIGVLDPIVLFDKTEAIATAKAMLTNIYEGTWNLKQKTAINEAISKVVEQRQKGKIVGFWHVIDELVNSKVEDVQDMGRFLISTIKGSVLELSFSRGDVKGLSFDAKVTILEIEDLDLPKEKNEVLDENKRLSVTLMFALGEFCAKFGSRNPKEETVVFFDESWIFQSSPEGRAILKSMKRVGRSQNNFMVLITQSVKDLDDGEDGTGFGMVICFDEVNNREGILNYLNLPVNETNLKWVSNMVQGQCLFKDMFNQINRVVVDVIFEEWLELFKTIDDTDASVMENQFVA